MCTCFNGTSNIAQAGGLACVSPEDIKVIPFRFAYYKVNTLSYITSNSKLNAVPKLAPLAAEKLAARLSCGCIASAAIFSIFFSFVLNYKKKNKKTSNSRKLKDE